jgi:hypothetical protein
LSQPRRRTFLTEPGLPLLLPSDAAGLTRTFHEFLTLSRLSADDVVITPLVTIPVPQLSRSAGPRGWPEDINPAVMWHPLFWLPERVALRYRYDDNSIETDQEWAVRVALETSVSLLFNPEDGTWFDPLHAAGLDIDDPAVQDRITAWLAGQEDPELDAIDLTDILEQQDDPHWAQTASVELLPTLVPASWALLADDLAQQAGELAIELDEPSEIAEQAHVLTILASSVLAGIPPLPNKQAPSELWAEISEELSQWAGGRDELVDGPIAQLEESLYEVRDSYWPFAEEVDRFISGAAE